MDGNEFGSAPIPDDRRRGSSRTSEAARPGPRARRPLVAGTAGVLLFVGGLWVGAAAGRATSDAIASPTVTATAGSGPVTGTSATATSATGTSATGAMIADGDWFVGVQVRPGSYRNTGPDCYWARLSGTSGTLDEIIANGIGAGVVTIEPQDYAFTSNRCSWALLG